VKKIVVLPAKILRERAQAAGRADKELEKLVEDLREGLEKSESGAGLAANQIEGKLRAVAIKDSETKEVGVYVNPVITAAMGDKSFIKMTDKEGKEEDFLEGCLSIPNYFGTVKRYLKIRVKWKELIEGRLEDKEGEFEGFEAVVFQHEIDHLDGILFVDRVKEDGGKFYKQEGEKLIRWEVEKVLELEKEKTKARG
jgi:peptide deformylase